MPEGASGAYVSCYAKADNYRLGVEKCIAALKIDGMYVEEILQPIQSMKGSQWEIHIVDQWPDHKDEMPTQEEFENSINNGDVVYGPFGSY